MYVCRESSLRPSFATRARSTLLGLAALTLLGLTPSIGFADPAIDGTWTLLELSPNLPSGSDGIMVYDSARNRAVYLYGTTVYGLSLDNPIGWEIIQTSGGSPPARSGGFAVYDPQADAIILWGGDVNNSFSGAIWRLLFADVPDVSSWQLFLAGGGATPAPRAYGGAVYNAVTHRMAICAGRNFCSTFADLWELSLDGSWLWTQLSSGGPIGGWQSSLDFDATSGLYWRYGGGWFQPPCYQLPVPWVRGLWSFPADQSAGWTSVRPFEHSIAELAVLDASRQRLVVLPTVNNGIIPTLPDPALVSLDTGNFTAIHPQGPAPNLYLGARNLVRDAAGDRVVFVHPQDSTNGVLRTWVWTWAATSGVGNDPVRHRPFVALMADRNPVNLEFRGVLRLDERAMVRIHVLDVAGRRVRRLSSQDLPAGESALSWNLRDDQNRRVSAGSYFLVAETPRGVARLKLTVTP